MRVGNFVRSRVGHSTPCVASVICLLTACGLGKEALALPGTTNLSLLPGVTATATGADFGSSISDAFDGNRDGNFGDGSVFYENANPSSPPLFFQMDLGANEYIDRVQLLRRTDADQAVFGPMNLTIYQDDGTGHPGSVSFTHNYNSVDSIGQDYFGVGSWGTTDPGSTAKGGAAGGTKGRFVRLERLDNNYWLTFSEFEVIGAQHPLTFTEDNNIAAGKPVTTSSPPGFGAQLTSGNDGNIDGSFGNGLYRPVYHSATPGVGEYWQVDLGGNTQLDHLQLFARGDNYTTSQYKVTVYGPDDTTVTGSYIVDNNPLTDPNPGYDHIVDTAGIFGEFIRVETTRSEYLSFSELRAFSGPGTTIVPGDYNHDGHVDVNDYNLWKQNFGSTSNLAADGNGNGVVDAADYVVWRSASAGSGAGAGNLGGSASVPEPSTAALAIGLVFLFRSRRR
jgi:hypothetical protein